MVTYLNGNVRVTIEKDGTKTREVLNWPPQPIWPESVDVKVTNKCNKGCVYCHENSVPDGEHFNVQQAISLFRNAPNGVELAIGGGNPIEQMDEVIELSENLPQIFVNMTINSAHIKDFYWLPLIGHRQKQEINAIGVSYNPADYNKMLAFQATCKDTKVQMVVHMIAGVHSKDDFENVFRDFDRVLILGYKKCGRGVEHYSKHVQERINELYVWLGHLIANAKALIAFDNLAVAQLNPKRYFTRDDWDRVYMGDDGDYTMYLDLVKGEYAISSTSAMRYKIENLTVPEMFAHVRGLKNGSV